MRKITKRPAPTAIKGRYIVGHHAIKASFKTYPKGVRALWLKRGWQSHQDLTELSDLARRLQVEVIEKSEAQIEEIAKSHQGAVLIQAAGPQWPELDELLALEKVTLVLLDGLEDPHNLGAIMRSAWLMGAKGIIVPEHRSVHLTPIVHKIASGGAEFVPLLVLPSFQSYLDELKQNGFWVFGLSHKAKQNVMQAKVPERIVWCIGAEDKGLRTTTEKMCDELLALPQADSQASYNASVAAGMVLFETFRQHSLKP